MRRKNNSTAAEKKHGKKRNWMVLGSILVVAGTIAAWIAWSNSTFEETFYTMESSKIEEPVRVILLADLHQASFGTGNEERIARVGALKPDAILLAGDVINKNAPDWDYAVNLCRGLTEIAPVYYGMGNHENEVLYGQDLNKEFLEAAADTLGDSKEDFVPLLRDGQVWNTLKDTGVQLLQNESTVVDIKGNSVKIGGVSTNLSSFWPYSGEFIYQFAEEDNQDFKILISHRPEPVKAYISDYAVDLVVSGHNHGGIVRIPGVGGLVSEAEGLFPTYDDGWFEWDRMTLVISRGLGGHGLIPRVFNKPELIIVDIN